MVYAAITSLMSTIQQSMQVTGLSLQVFYEEIESMRAILEKLCDITGWTDSKMKNWMAVKNRLNNIQHLKEQTLTLPSASQHAFESENVMVGHENTFEIMQDRLARGRMELEVVTIVDMGGIGKTTLATKIYNDPFTISRFDIRSKVTVSHKYCCFFKSRGRTGIHNEEELSRCRNYEAHSIILFGQFQCSIPELPFKLVRVLDLSSISCPTFPIGILHLIHLRYLALCVYPRLEKYLGSEVEVCSSIIDIPPLISSLCYLQNFTLYFPYYFSNRKYPFTLPLEILAMPQLRYLHLDWNYLQYYEPTFGSENLQCLSGWNPRYCTGSAYRLFPNLKKLQICGVREDFYSRKDLYDFRYLDQLEEFQFNLIDTFPACFLENISPSGSTLQDPPRFWKKMIGSSPAISVPPLLLPPPDAFPQKH
ncbi:hypothetical protein CQW23_06151 [Capsicum baccatum]|uniref:NB-ARC domain-containing protein n=1 Tax=Capsicum baccatum TaxID=33114 RepID=A0A2G2X2N4_CAPBA|nr:hypothetical protein CQW23_06151 [Capsicum baccatum]